MRKCANISPYILRPLVIYDFATAPLRIFIYDRKILIFFFISVPAAQKEGASAETNRLKRKGRDKGGRGGGLGRGRVDGRCRWLPRST
jgi:hypothetical protein